MTSNYPSWKWQVIHTSDKVDGDARARQTLYYRVVTSGEVFDMDSSADRADDLTMALNGDLDALERLFILYEPRIFNLSLVLLGDPDDARDATQETLIRWYRHFSQFDASRKLWPWVRTICVNVCRTMMARKNRRSFFQRLFRRSRAIRPNPDTESIFITRETAWTILKSLRVLTPNERLVIVLRDVEDLEMDEIARMMGCSPGTVRSHLSRGRMRLRQYFRSSKNPTPSNPQSPNDKESSS